MTRRRLAYILTAVFVLSIIMGVGPGVLLVNRPGDIFGLPPLYAWGILWYLVQVVVAVVAYIFLWGRSETDDSPTGSPVPDTTGGHDPQ